jgi:hypothetical protein
MTPRNLVCLGWSARDRNQLEDHIRELAKLGIRGPKEIPEAFIVSPDLAITESEIKVEHGQTCGEVEYVLVMIDGKMYVTVGSDHTDRKLEAEDILKSKQRYPKVLSKELWPFEEVIDHWDKIILRSWCGTDVSSLERYQEATLSELITPDDALQKFRSVFHDPADAILFSGTIPTVNGKLDFSNILVMEMSDPVMNRVILSGYIASRDQF